MSRMSNVLVVLTLASACTTTAESSGEPDLGESVAASTVPAAQNIGYAYAQVTAPAGGLTATNVEDAINQCAAVAYQGDATLATNLDNEVSRAETVEGSLATGLANETARATTVESALAANLNNEIDRALAAESTLTSTVQSVIHYFEGVDSALQANLAAEISRAQAVELTLAASVANETLRSETADAVLATNLNNETSRAHAAEATLATSLAAETTRATQAEGTVLTTAESYANSVAGAGTVYVAQSGSASEDVSATTGQVVATVALPAHSYLVFAKTNMTAPDSTASCDLRLESQVGCVDANQLALLDVAPGPTSGAVSLQGLASVPTGGANLTLCCHGPSTTQTAWSSVMALPVAGTASSP